VSNHGHEGVFQQVYPGATGDEPRQTALSVREQTIKEGLEPLKIRDYRDGNNAVARYDIQNIKNLRKMSQGELRTVYKQLGFS
jgi:hypothetical protein